MMRSPARSCGATGLGVTAYVIDTGVLAAHADFGGRVAAGYTTIVDGRGTTDCNGHGTHVSGTLAGARFGVAKGATVVPVRVLDCAGSGTTAGVIAGLDWAIADHQAGQPAVANLRLGGGRSTLLDAVAALVADGVTVSVAAGNSATDACTQSPSAVPTALTVAASTAGDLSASFSNIGKCVDLYAPGASITSDWASSSTATAVLSGTSMASAHVAGAAALLLSTHPAWTPVEVGGRLLADATFGALGSVPAGTPNLLLDTNPTPVTAPVAPVIGTAVAGNAVVLARWTASANGGAAVTGRNQHPVRALERRHSGDGSPSAGRRRYGGRAGRHRHRESELDAVGGRRRLSRHRLRRHGKPHQRAGFGRQPHRVARPSRRGSLTRDEPAGRELRVHRPGAQRGGAGRRVGAIQPGRGAVTAAQ